MGIRIGDFIITYYALIIMSGVIAAALMAFMEAKRRMLDTEVVWDILPWLVIAGIVGARLWHIFTPSETDVANGITTLFYLTHPWDAINIRNGGLGIPGGVIGGVIAFLIFAKKKNLDAWVWFDVIAPGLAVAQAIGRWGNFFNQELYGAPSDLPWAITIDPYHRLPGYESISTYHPLFLYECLLNLLNAGILLLVARKFKKQHFYGDIFLLYLVFYPAIRFGLEFLRLNPSNVGGVNINQLMMAVIGVAALVVLVLRHTIWKTKLAERQLRSDEKVAEEIITREEAAIAKAAEDAKIAEEKQRIKALRAENRKKKTELEAEEKNADSDQDMDA